MTEPVTPPATGDHSALAPLREPNFRYYFLSRLINSVGGVMAGVALAFAVLEVSSSATALGVVLAAHSIPMVVFLLAGGVIADRFGRSAGCCKQSRSPNHHRAHTDSPLHVIEE